MKTLDILKMSQLYYPIMLTQQMGEISEGKACELLGMDHETYRETKHAVANAVVNLLESLPSPLTLLLESTKGKPSSSGPAG